MPIRVPLRFPIGVRQAQPPPSTPSAKSNAGVAVCVISHNYGRFLATAIESMLAQTRPATEVLVVDDASTDDTPQVAKRFADRGVRYLRIAACNVHQARAAGLQHTSAEWLCFLDADDILPPDYLALAAVHFDKPNVGIVYSDVQMFGEKNQRASYPPFEDCSLAQRNFIHAGSLVRRVALETAGVFDESLPPKAQDDWFLWRRVAEVGWRTTKSQAVYQYRRHSDSRSFGQMRKQASYFELAALSKEQVTLAIPLSGRTALWPQMRSFLESQTWPHTQTRLLLVDTSQSHEFSRDVREWLASCDYPWVEYIGMSVGKPGLADRDRRRIEVRRAVQRAMPRIYNRIRQECPTEYLWIVEDDLLPPINVCKRLLRSFDADTASVAAPFRSRFHDGYVAWDADWRTFKEPGVGVQVIGGNGFGCVILRKSVLDQFLFHHAGQGDYDPNFYVELRETRYAAKMDWGCECGHWSH